MPGRTAVWIHLRGAFFARTQREFIISNSSRLAVALELEEPRRHWPGSKGVTILVWRALNIRSTTRGNHISSILSGYRGAT